MPVLTRSRMLAAALVLLAATPFIAAADGGVVERSSSSSSPSYIVVGFVGGFARHDNPHQGPVLFAQRAQRDLPMGSYVHVFENRHRKSAYKTIVDLLDRNRDGSLNSLEKAQARIILFGHSWGGSAVVLLARELDRAGIPVLLTVQVDSVAKPWQHDGTIPDNVVAAANFYQTHGFVHGRAQITAADKAKTQILGNYRFDYQQAPVKCEAHSWFDRITPTHAQSACDPSLWSQVEDLLRQRIGPDSGVVAAIQPQ